MGANPDLPSKARRWLNPRFSLKVLLLAFTAVAIGFPIWYRWPYTEESQLPEDTSRPPTFKIVTTWRRTWGGGREKHGPETRVTPDGKSRVVTHYKNGVKSGPYAEYFDDVLRLSGQFMAGERSGEWK